MPKGVPRVVREDGTTWCSKNDGHWVHITGFYLKKVRDPKKDLKYYAWNETHTERVLYPKPANSWCKDCINGRTPGAQLPYQEPSRAVNLDYVHPDDRAKLIAEYERRQVQPSTPSYSMDDLPYQRPAEYSVPDRDWDTPDEPEPEEPPVIGSDGHEYPADPEQRFNMAHERLGLGIITPEEFERVTDL